MLTGRSHSRLTDLERENTELRRASHGDALDISEEADESLSGPDRQLASLRRLLRSAEDRETALKCELQKLRQSSPGSDDCSPSPMDSSADASDELQPSAGLMVSQVVVLWLVHQADPPA